MLLRMDSLSQLLLYNACEPLCNGVHLVLARKRHRDSEELIRSQIRCTMRQYGHCDSTELVVVSYRICFSMTNLLKRPAVRLHLDFYPRQHQTDRALLSMRSCSNRVPFTSSISHFEIPRCLSSCCAIYVTQQQALRSFRLL